MSWSASGKAIHRGDDPAGDRPPVELNVAFAPQQGYAEEESKAQYEEAEKAVVLLITSGKWGSEGEYTVSMGGHANPGATPEGGWANDYVSISISKSTPQPAQPETQPELDS